jgi:nitrate/nitrite transport system substrate-binding protein
MTGKSVSKIDQSITRRNLGMGALAVLGSWACSRKSTGGAGPTASSSAQLATLDLPDTDLEKPSLKLGFIKLTDCVPLIIAKEKGFFKQYGLNVELGRRPIGKFCSTG